MKFKLSMQEDIPPFIQQSPSLWSGKHLAPFSNVKISILNPDYLGKLEKVKLKPN